MNPRKTRVVKVRCPQYARLVFWKPGSSQGPFKDLGARARKGCSENIQGNLVLPLKFALNVRREYCSGARSPTKRTTLVMGKRPIRIDGCSAIITITITIKTKRIVVFAR